jgi:arylsulfatase A
VIEEIDAGVGKILKALKDQGIDEQTLIVFTSDNGPWLPFETHGGSAGLLRQGKGTTYEGGMREPTIFYWPGTIKPGVQMELGTTMDLLPTFCSIAGVEVPKDRVLDGYNLAPLLTSKTDKGPREVVYFWREEQLYAVRVGPWKVHFITQGCYGIGEPKKVLTNPEVYHLDTDPSEQYNVAELHPEVIVRAVGIADAHRKTIVPVEDQLAKRGEED